MELSQFTDYSLRVLIREAACKHRERTSAGGIAQIYAISCNHVAKVAHHLSKPGYLDAVRGRGGGLVLSHPQFSGSIKELSLPVKANFSDFKITKVPGGFHCNGQVNSKIPVYALVAYVDPEGGSDYDATTVTATPDDGGRFLLKCTTHAAGKNAQLRIIACHVNGATSKKAFSYSVAGDGSVDISAARAK